MSNATEGLLDKKINTGWIRCDGPKYKVEKEECHYTLEKYKPPKPRKLKTEYVKFPTSYYHPKMD